MNLKDIIEKLEKVVLETTDPRKKNQLLSELEKHKQNLANMKKASIRDLDARDRFANS